MEKQQRSSMHRTIGWASVAYGAFTALSVIGPILLQRFWARQRQQEQPLRPQKR